MHPTILDLTELFRVFISNQRILTEAIVGDSLIQDCFGSVGWTFLKELKRVGK